jgi:exoribonuclease R
MNDPLHFSVKTGLKESESEDILIPGRQLRNRAVDGDLVAVEILPKSEWRSKQNRLASSNDQVSILRTSITGRKVFAILKVFWWLTPLFFTKNKPQKYNKLLYSPKIGFLL